VKVECNLRLISLHVREYRRLLDVKINLAGKIIAIVGPNEAGKTSFLDALARLTSGDAVPPQDVSRINRPVDPETVYLTAEYILDEEDQKTLSDLDLVEMPVRMTYQRKLGGGVPIIGFHPKPVRRRTDFEAALKALQEANINQLDELGQQLRADDDEEADEPLLGRRLDFSWRALLDTAVGLPDALVSESERTSNDLDKIGERGLASHLRYVTRWQTLPEAGQEARNRIHARTPRYVIFTDADRNLLGEYDIQGPAAEAPPPALANLARLAELDLVQLLVAIQEGDHGRMVTMQNRANGRLAEVFTRSWRQSVITVELNIQGTIIRILIKENNDIVTSFDERSAGLRMFVALAAFVATKNIIIPPILLIDEAEMHLHYDAQADLVNMLLTQQEAAQVIYTTHSPGCLPPDLGTGIRVIAPRADNPAVSEARNAFWLGHVVGFSPLLLAMGAGAAAFTTTRYALLAEGASEMILLPSLIRAATGLDILQYQVAPGLSEAPTSQYPDLDLQAARVAFVVDGDSGGLTLRNRLEASGVPGNRIVTLDNMTLEDTVDLDAYRAAVHSEAVAANGKDLPEMPAGEYTSPRAVAVKTWFEGAGLVAPSKIAVANRLVLDDKVVPSEQGRQVLKDLHDQVTSILGLQS
jgi:predicted ATP-dependent endonuclease of OLD family